MAVAVAAAQAPREGEGMQEEREAAASTLMDIVLQVEKAQEGRAAAAAEEVEDDENYEEEEVLVMVDLPEYAGVALFDEAESIELKVCMLCVLCVCV